MRAGLKSASVLPVERKRSWYERNHRGISDEDLKKVLGMNRQELQEWAKDKPVGPRQPSRLAGDHLGEGNDAGS